VTSPAPEFDRLAAACEAALREVGGIAVERGPERLAAARDWAFAEMGVAGWASVRVVVAPDPAGGWLLVEERDVAGTGGAAPRRREEERLASPEAALDRLRERLALDPFGPR
jgi:hypothetical protein